jgi:hypothetical protein
MSEPARASRLADTLIGRQANEEKPGTCASCKYATMESFMGTLALACHRYPPHLLLLSGPPALNLGPFFAPVQPIWGCGEWCPKVLQS